LGYVVFFGAGVYHIHYRFHLFLLIFIVFDNSLFADTSILYGFAKLPLRWAHIHLLRWRKYIGLSECSNHLHTFDLVFILQWFPMLQGRWSHGHASFVAGSLASPPSLAGSAGVVPRWASMVALGLGTMIRCFMVRVVQGYSMLRHALAG